MPRSSLRLGAPFTFRAAVVVTNAAITCADTATDVSIIALYSGSVFGTILLVHFVVAMVSLIHVSVVIRARRR